MFLSFKIFKMEAQTLYGISQVFTEDSLAESNSNHRKVKEDLSHVKLPKVSKSSDSLLEDYLLNKVHKTTETLGPQKTRAKRNSDIDLLIHSCEAYHIWKIQAAVSKTKEQYQKLISHIARKYVEAAEKYNEDEETEQWFHFEHTSCLGALCFFAIEIGKFKYAKLNLEKAKAFVRVCADKAYLEYPIIDSFDYVLDYLELYASKVELEEKEGNKIFPVFKLKKVSRKKFLELDSLTRAGILCMRYYFYRSLSMPIHLQIQAIKMAIDANAGNAEWFLCLHEALRHRRLKDHKYHHMYPWDAEINAISTVFYLDKHNPRGLLAEVILIAEIIKNQLQEPKWHTVRLADGSLRNLTSAKRYLGDQAGTLMRVASRSLRLTLKLSEVFLVILPYGHRDYRLGKEVLEHCMRIQPDSSTVNHRMAEFYLIVENNHKRAEMYYDFAFRHNPRNFSALLAKIQLRMRRVSSRKLELFGLLDSQLKGNVWDFEQEATLRYLKALALFIDSQPREAVQILLEAYEQDPKSVTFQDLPLMHYRFGWFGWPSQTRISYNSIRTILNTEKKVSNYMRKKMITKLIKVLDEAVEMDSRDAAGDRSKRR